MPWHWEAGVEGAPQDRAGMPWHWEVGVEGAPQDRAGMPWHWEVGVEGAPQDSCVSGWTSESAKVGGGEGPEASSNTPLATASVGRKAVWLSNRDILQSRKGAEPNIYMTIQVIYKSL
jgi:hypothetical protein